MKKLYLFLIMCGVQTIMAEELPDIIGVTDSGQKVVIPPVAYAVGKSLFSLLQQDKEKQQSYNKINGFSRFHFYEFLNDLKCIIYPTLNGYSTFIIKLEVDSQKEEHHPLRKEFLNAIHYVPRGFESEVVKEDEQTKISIISFPRGVRFIKIETYLSQEQIAVLLKDLQQNKK